MKHPGLAGVILAAGDSSRLGQPKQCLNHGGTPMLTNICKLLSGLCQQVFCVVGAHERKVRTMIPRDTEVIMNQDWARGMGNSLALAINHVPDWADGILIALTDQPLIATAHYASLVTTWEANRSKLVTTRTETGDLELPPLILPAHLRTHFETLDGDVGGREIIRSAGKNKQSVSCENAALDIDQPADLKLLNRQRPKQSS